MNLKTQSSHWYRCHNGVTEPCYELPRKSGGGMKAVTLREARELSLLPSVTTVLSVIAKPELTNWLVGNGIMAAITLPQLPGEAMDDFVKRVIEDADRQSQTARDFGTRIHDSIESFLTTPTGSGHLEDDIGPFVHETFNWLSANVEAVNSVEACIGCPIIGVAGRLDLACVTSVWGPAVIDFKTQKVRERPAFYPEFGLQIAAYAKLKAAPLNGVFIWPKLISVVIDSSKPGPPHIKVWEDAETHWRMFQCAFELWCHLKGYDPRQKA